jgi:hypothetical protein
MISSSTCLNGKVQVRFLVTIFILLFAFVGLKAQNTGNQNTNI